MTKDSGGALERKGGEDKLATEGVVGAVAEATERDPSTLPLLYDAINPDALDVLASSEGVSVVFEYAGYEIHVGRANDIEIREPND